MVSRFQAAARILEYRGPINRGLKEKQRNQEKSILGENICIHKCYATNTHTHTKQKWRTKRIKRKWKWKRKTCQGFGPISWLLVINALSAASSNLLFPFPRTQNLVLFVKKALCSTVRNCEKSKGREREKRKQWERRSQNLVECGQPWSPLWMVVLLVCLLLVSSNPLIWSR